MRISENFGDPVAWAQAHFGGIQVGDKRRTARVVALAAGWARQPGASIPRLAAGNAYATKAAYGLLALPAATPDTLQAAHRQRIGEALAAPGTYLLLEDTSEVRWPDAAAPGQRRPGLGPVGAGKATGQGVLLHSLVAAAWPDPDPTPAAKRPALPLLGLLDQQFQVRVPRLAAEKPRRGLGMRPPRARESDLWWRSLRAVGSPPPGARWVVVADRAADTYEHLRQCQRQGLGFVVRAAQDRSLAAPGTTRSVGRLFACARAQPSAGTFALALPAQAGRPAREVTLHVSYTPALALRAPQRPGGATGTGQPVPAGAVRVWEAAAPGRAAPGLEWVLVCDQPAADFAQAHACARQYAARWLVEEFHKALKTGLRAERLQLHTAARLFAAVALLSVVALALVDLREQSRATPDEPARAAGLSPSFLRMLAVCSRRPLRTVHDVFAAVAALGCHLGRAGDGPPGWQTLWHGFSLLRLLVEGAHLADQLTEP